MFSSHTCPHCRQAKDYLSSKGISFTEKDINFDSDARNQLSQMNVMGVPAFLVDGELVIGFDRQRLDYLLSREIVSCPECSAKLRVPSGKGKIKIKCSVCTNEFFSQT